MVLFPHYHRDKRRAMHGLFEPLNPKLGAEVGTWNGNTSRSLLITFPDLTLYMIDRWTPPPKDDSWEGSGDRFALYDQSKHDDAYANARRVTEPFNDRRRILRMSSCEAARKCIADESLDFAFIDADHSFEGTLSDIESYWPKVKSGGLLSGHDYGCGGEVGRNVAKAVIQFFGPLMFGSYEVLLETFIWFARKP